MQAAAGGGADLLIEVLPEHEVVAGRTRISARASVRSEYHACASDDRFPLRGARARQLYRSGWRGGIEAGEKLGGGVATDQPLADLGQAFGFGDRPHHLGQAGGGVVAEARRRLTAQQGPLLLKTLFEALLASFAEPLLGPFGYSLDQRHRDLLPRLERRYHRTRRRQPLGHLANPIHQRALQLPRARIAHPELQCLPHPQQIRV